MQLAVHLIKQLNSAVFILIIILIVCIYLVWQVSKLVERWRLKSDDLSQLKNNWNKDIPDLKVKVDLIYNAVISGGTVFQKNSPAILTKMGKDIIEKVNAYKIIDDNIDKLKKINR